MSSGKELSKSTQFVNLHVGHKSSFWHNCIEIDPIFINFFTSLFAGFSYCSSPVKDLSPNHIIYVLCPLIFWVLTLTTLIHAQAVFWKFSHKLDFTQTLGLSLLE